MFQHDKFNANPPTNQLHLIFFFDKTSKHWGYHNTAGDRNSHL